MKLLFENWRQYLNEEEQIKILDGFEPPAIFTGRTMIVANTSEGPIGFYKSTGTGTPELGTEDMWLPFGGVCGSVGCTSDEIESGMGKGAWIIKLPKSHSQAERSKIPKKGSEFYNIGLQLAKMNINVPNWSDWMKSKGYPSWKEFNDVYNDAFQVRQQTGKAQPKTNPIDYGNMAINFLLNTNKALKAKEWASGKAVFGSAPVYVTIDGKQKQLATLPQIKTKFGKG